MDGITQSIYGDDDDFGGILELIYVSDDACPTWYGGWRAGGPSNTQRYHDKGVVQLYKNYLAPTATYPKLTPSRRYRLPRRLFVHICNVRERDNIVFQHCNDCSSLPGFDKHQKCTAAMRLIAYGTCDDNVNEYLRMDSFKVLQCIKELVNTIFASYKHKYLRPPSKSEFTT